MVSRSASIQAACILSYAIWRQKLREGLALHLSCNSARFQDHYEIAAVVGDPNFVRRTNGEPVFVTGYTRPREVAQYFYVSDERVADRTADDLMKQYGNRPLWFYGDVEFYARGDIEDCPAVLRVNTPVRISGIHRLRDNWSKLPLGNHRQPP